MATELCHEFGITESKLNELVEMGLIKPHNDIFTERNTLVVIYHCSDDQYQFLKTYAHTTKKLAEQEVKIRMAILGTIENQNECLKHFFDVLLLLKLYVLNLQILNTYQKE
ncbi:hypothetical protein [Actinobacillus capsulatus]|uniref:hypothetical protein n=1 Tax=Actinobacillus capsulatus TaxID=717 RepID=UPI00038138DF|nr:hypothetical protein [Actinobacillus capsulatus]